MRLRRPSWRDPRLLVGMVLVGVSVAVGSWAVAAAGSTTAVHVAAGPLIPGAPLTAEDLDVRHVRLAEGAPYLEATSELPAGLVVVRGVGAGELVPLSALAEGQDLGLRPVAITPSGDLSSDLVAGAAVDLWFVPDRPLLGGVAPASAGDSTAATNAPHQLASALTVAEVSAPQGAFAVGARSTVHVLVPVEDLADVLAAMASAGSVAVVPVPAGVAGS
ncbi:hypothetical protein [Actinotalea sp. K2]|uniref:hypothetical protein n=1 Tax=Actinotalea sp. K2 TaxID=2939438 RepID=UPI002016CDFD|nr:hypothetical protein [Actinotalea sp. K2]MCL3862659.1 hypothetical protein [Actinotalea sp. K2]